MSQSLNQPTLPDFDLVFPADTNIIVARCNGHHFLAWNTFCTLSFKILETSN